MLILTKSGKYELYSFLLRFTSVLNELAFM